MHCALRSASDTAVVSRRRKLLASVLLGFALGLGLIGPSPAAAQEADTASTPLTDALRAHAYPLRLEDGALRGSGGAWLREQAIEAPVVTLGESHATKEIPAVMAALIRHLQAADAFDHLAIEVSPWTTERITGRLRAGRAAYDAFIEQHPAAIPFYNLKTERDLLHQVVSQSDEAQPLWGLDQIFVFATEWALNRLMALAPSEAARSAVEAVRAAGDAKSAEDPRLQKLPDTMPAPLSVYTPAAFDTLRTYFEGIDEAQRLLAELAISTRIYRLNDTDNYRSNQIRARYLRDNLRRPALEAITASDDAPQIVIKVGGYHAYRGLTPNHALDVGTLGVTLARMMSGEALNVAIVCGPGSQNTQFPAGTGDCFRPLAKPFAAAMDDAPTLFDLTAIHPMLHDGTVSADGPLADLLWAVDAVVLIPNATPADPIAPPTGQ